MLRKVCLNAKRLLLPLAQFQKTLEGRRLVVRGKIKKLARPPWTARLAEMDAQSGVAQGCDPAPAGLWEPRGWEPRTDDWRGGAGQRRPAAGLALGVDRAHGEAGEAQVAWCPPARLYSPLTPPPQQIPRLRPGRRGCFREKRPDPDTTRSTLRPIPGKQMDASFAMQSPLLWAV